MVRLKSVAYVSSLQNLTNYVLFHTDKNDCHYFHFRSFSPLEDKLIINVGKF